MSPEYPNPSGEIAMGSEMQYFDPSSLDPSSYDPALAQLYADARRVVVYLQACRSQWLSHIADRTGIPAPRVHDAAQYLARRGLITVTAHASPHGPVDKITVRLPSHIAHLPTLMSALYAAGPSGIRIADLTAATTTNRATLHRIMSYLQDRGAIQLTTVRTDKPGRPPYVAVLIDTDMFALYSPQYMPADEVHPHYSPLSEPSARRPVSSAPPTYSPPPPSTDDPYLSDLGPTYSEP